MTIVTNWESASVLVFMFIFGISAVNAWFNDRREQRKSKDKNDTKRAD